MGEQQKATIGAQDPAGPGYGRLARDPERRVLAGVCTGLGRYTGIDPVVYRVGFGLLVLTHGQGVILYIAAALLMPSRPGESSRVEQLLRRWFDAPAVLTILGALLCLGVVGSVFGGVSTDAIAIVVVFGLVLLISHARGVDLVSVARSVPERLVGHPPQPYAARRPADTPTGGGISLDKDVPAGTGGGLPEGMVDLAAYGSRSTATEPPLTDPAPGATAAPYPGPPAGTPARQRRHSPVASISLLAAMAAGAAMIPVARGYPAPDSWMIVMAPALAVVGLGLLAGGWFRTRGLAATGTVLTLALLTTSVAAEAPRNAKYGDVEWRPVDAGRSFQEYKVAVGKGALDLTALPVPRGQRVTVNAEVLLGELKVTVPRTARVVLDARLMLGDLRVGQRTISGPNAKAVEVMEPDGKPAKNPPEIVLRIRGKVGDVQVDRV
ncbi:PspC domain-containing protein [Actinomadura rubrisoli]|nr:PspC domain-containing protein [Actinomadura rubrisoli]